MCIRDSHYAIPKPKTPEEKQKEKERQAQLGLPTFRYHPDPLDLSLIHISCIRGAPVFRQVEDIKKENLDTRLWGRCGTYYLQKKD